MLHQQPTGELLLDVRTEAGQQLEGLPAADCCLQVRTSRWAVCCTVGVPAAGDDSRADRGVQRYSSASQQGMGTWCSRTDVCSGTGGASSSALQNERDDTVDDLVKSDFLHEPGWALAAAAAADGGGD